MRAPSEENFLQALSFLPPELRVALADAPDGSTCSALPARQVALLWCDISGFSQHTNELLATSADAVENLHREIREHYAQLLENIRIRGGEPVTFVGDGLLSVWPVGPQNIAAAVASAITTAQSLVNLRKSGATQFDLNNHISCGEIRTLELGGRHGRWLRSSVGSALKELENIADLKRPNEIILSARAAAFCSADSLSEPIGDQGACTFLGDLPSNESVTTELAVPGIEAWPATVERLPRSAVGWIDSIGLRFLADLRPVTSINVALHGFDHSATGSASRLDEIVQAIQDVVHRRDGYVADVIVDEKGASVLITFGTPPDAHSDDPLRSVLSATEILDTLVTMGIKSSVGVATGRALCSIVGNSDRRCYLVLGDALIRSTRLSNAIENGVLADDNTRRATQDTVSYQNDPLMMTFKGADEPAPVWAVTSDQTKSTAPRKIAGREREITLLFDLWKQAVTGDGCPNVIIEADSGFGKTSLALNLRSKVEAQGGVFILEAASAIEQEAPFSVLRRLVMEKLKVSSIGLAKTRRDTVLANVPEHLRDSAPLLNALFPTGLSDTDFTADLTGNARAEHIRDLVIDLLTAAFADKSTCLCIDDAQWLDNGTRQVLARLARVAPHLMIIIISQPLSDGNWDQFTGEASFKLMRIGPFSEEELRDLICLRLSCAQVEDNLLEQIASRTDRHPFFSVEMLQSLSDVGAIFVENGTARMSSDNRLDSASLPDTLHGMVLQRLDQLQPEEQLTIRVASVAGLSFPAKLVCDIHPLLRSASEVSRQLSQQVSNGFLIEQSANDLLGFAFSHGIVREVAHSQLPLPQRSGLHAEAAEWIEGHTGDDRASKLLELAHHWTEAGISDRAVACLLEEALRLFSQGFAVEAVQVGMRAIVISGIDVPVEAAALHHHIEQNMAIIERLTNERHPTELIAQIQLPDPDLLLSLQALLSIAPFAFQSNQFETFAWASTEAMRLVIENSAGPPHAFSMYSIVKALLTGDKAAGAAWSQAALDLDAATGGAALPAAAFIDTWFHSHWRVPLRESIDINRAGAERAFVDNDVQYSSYNVAGGVMLGAAIGHSLSDVIAHGEQALTHRLHRNSRMHVVLEMQFARALREETANALSLSSEGVDEGEDIAWVTETEFANQIGYYICTRARLHRHAGDWEGAMSWSESAADLRPAIAGQIAEIELVFHTLLARFGSILSIQSSLNEQREEIENEIAQLAQWRRIQQDNFSVKAQLAEFVLEGLLGEKTAADRLSDLANSLGPSEWLQDRALALEYAARLQPSSERLDHAIQAYMDWGATGVARRLRAHGL